MTCLDCGGPVDDEPAARCVPCSDLAWAHTLRFRSWRPERHAERQAQWDADRADRLRASRAAFDPHAARPGRNLTA